jgi:quinol monooxygenase YgiN
VSTVHVLAMITAKPGLRDTVLELFHANVPAVHAEDGCIEYGAAVDVDVLGRFQALLGPDSFVVIEKWASAEALRAHGASAHMAAYAAKTKELLAARAIHVLSPA